MTTYVATTLPTPDGAFTMIERGSDNAVVASGWSSQATHVAARNRDIARWSRGVCAHVDAVEAYYDGELDLVLKVPVDQPGTALQNAFWSALRDIAAGSTVSYAELASTVGRPTAARAAGGACARNAPALFVPCHRVVGASGSLTGFAWGVPVKQRLLSRESGQR